MLKLRAKVGEKFFFSFVQSVRYAILLIDNYRHDLLLLFELFFPHHKQGRAKNILFYDTSAMIIWLLGRSYSAEVSGNVVEEDK